MQNTSLLSSATAALPVLTGSVGSFKLHVSTPLLITAEAEQTRRAPFEDEKVSLTLLLP